jgi:hypothetical protein
MPFQFVPQFRMLDKVIGLLPKTVLGVFTVVPPVGDYAVLARFHAGQIGRLGRASESGKNRADGMETVAIPESTDPGHVRPDE